jgi:FkbM family methyltransferase
MSLTSSLRVLKDVVAEDRQFNRLGCRRGWFLRFYYQGRLNDRLGRAQPWREVELSTRGRKMLMSLTPSYLGGLSGIFIDNEYDCAALLGFEPRTILDLGANIGFGSLFLSALFPGAAIVAVEPDPRNVQALKRNLQLNGLSVTTLEAAAGSREGTMLLRFGDDPLCSSLETTNMHALPNSVPVSVVTVPEILRRMGWPRLDLLKVDIEGAEEDLFANDAGWLADVRAIVMEIHPNTTPARIGELLRRYGFTLARLGTGREPVYLATRPST